MTRQDLIDLAIEYGMIHSTAQFNQMNRKMQEAVLRQIERVRGR